MMKTINKILFITGVVVAVLCISEGAAAKVRMNLAEYLEKGFVK